MSLKKLYQSILYREDIQTEKQQFKQIKDLSQNQIQQNKSEKISESNNFQNISYLEHNTIEIDQINKQKITGQEQTFLAQQNIKHINSVQNYLIRKNKMKETQLISHLLKLQQKWIKKQKQISEYIKKLLNAVNEKNLLIQMLYQQNNMLQQKNYILQQKNYQIHEALNEINQNVKKINLMKNQQKIYNRNIYKIQNQIKQGKNQEQKKKKNYCETLQTKNQEIKLLENKILSNMMRIIQNNFEIQSKQINKIYKQSLSPIKQEYQSSKQQAQFNPNMLKKNENRSIISLKGNNSKNAIQNQQNSRNLQVQDNQKTSYKNYQNYEDQTYSPIKNNNKQSDKQASKYSKVYQSPKLFKNNSNFSLNEEYLRTEQNNYSYNSRQIPESFTPKRQKIPQNDSKISVSKNIIEPQIQVQQNYMIKNKSPKRSQHDKIPKRSQHQFQQSIMKNNTDQQINQVSNNLIKSNDKKILSLKSTKRSPNTQAQTSIRQQITSNRLTNKNQSSNNSNQIISQIYQMNIPKSSPIFYISKVSEASSIIDQQKSTVSSRNNSFNIKKMFIEQSNIQQQNNSISDIQDQENYSLSSSLVSQEEYYRKNKDQNDWERSKATQYIKIEGQEGEQCSNKYNQQRDGDQSIKKNKSLSFKIINKVCNNTQVPLQRMLISKEPIQNQKSVNRPQIRSNKSPQVSTAATKQIRQNSNSNSKFNNKNKQKSSQILNCLEQDRSDQISGVKKQLFVLQQNPQMKGSLLFQTDNTASSDKNFFLADQSKDYIKFNRHLQNVNNNSNENKNNLKKAIFRGTQTDQKSKLNYNSVNYQNQGQTDGKQNKIDKFNLQNQFSQNQKLRFQNQLLYSYNNVLDANSKIISKSSKLTQKFRSQNNNILKKLLK